MPKNMFTLSDDLLRQLRDLVQLCLGRWIVRRNDRLHEIEDVGCGLLDLGRGAGRN